MTPPPSGRGSRASLVSRQRAAVERLKSTLFGTDPYVRRRYILDFHREFRSYKAAVSLAAIEEASLRADVVFVGDYHALPSCQVFAADLLRRLARDPRPVVLFLEMVFARHQKALDEFLAGRMDEEELRRRIHYDRDWGYPWEGYGRLLSAARECGVAVVAADAPPRSGLRLIRRRDRHAARKIREKMVGDPRPRALVLFGESHMAAHHLPAEVNAELRAHAVQASSIVIVQNAEELHWSLARSGIEGAEAVQVDPRRYCVFNASPLAKYEAYRQTLLRWSQQEDEVPDFGPSLHHLIDLLVGYLGLDRYRTLVSTSDGPRIPLVDIYPEVVTRRDRRRRSLDGRPRRRRPRPGMVYRQGPNRIDVYAFSLAAAGESASRFLLAALRGRAGRTAAAMVRLGRPSPGEGGPRGRMDRAGAPTALPFGSTILDEAFVAFFVHYLDPGTPPRSVGGDGVAAPFAGGRSRGSYTELLKIASAPPKIGRRNSPRRVRAARGAWLGELLGEALYSRITGRSDGRRTQRWLREVAALAPERAGQAADRLDRLLYEAAAQMGWVRPRRT